MNQSNDTYNGTFLWLVRMVFTSEMNHSRVHLTPSRWTREWLSGWHQSWRLVFTPTQTNGTKELKDPGFGSTGPNKAGVCAWPSNIWQSHISLNEPFLFKPGHSLLISQRAWFHPAQKVLRDQSDGFRCDLNLYVCCTISNRSLILFPFFQRCI